MLAATIVWAYATFNTVKDHDYDIEMVEVDVDETKSSIIRELDQIQGTLDGTTRSWKRYEDGADD